MVVLDPVAALGGKQEENERRPKSGATSATTWHQVQGLPWILCEMFFFTFSLSHFFGWLNRQRLCSIYQNVRGGRRVAAVRSWQAAGSSGFRPEAVFAPAGPATRASQHRHQLSKKLQLQHQALHQTFLTTLPHHGLLGPGYRCSGRFEQF